MLTNRLDQGRIVIYLSSKKEKMPDRLHQIPEDLFNKEILPIIEKHTMPIKGRSSKNTLSGYDITRF
ncbi:MAG: hypothetical protein MTP17_00155 [Candidatus Midichloria sp.]|nr:MAG: hypothetical protein MTP17_03525 [Candidatus Midichloria sp.]WHQ46809.1 MAG: hypothetical protein MTP17_00155 [Candidatus Midichloria sp.]